MMKDVKKLEKELMMLGIDDRAFLAEKLIISLDAPSDEENLQLWVMEAERRLQDLRQGRAKEIPSEKVIRDVRARLS